MIVSFRDKTTWKVYSRQITKRLHPDIARKAKMKLDLLHAATEMPRTSKSVTTTSGEVKMTIKNEETSAAYWEHSPPPDPIFGEPVHPGVVLLEEFLKPLGVSISRFASDLGITYRRAHEICTGKRGLSAETALLLAKYFRMSPQFWLNLQSHYELECLRGQMKEKLGRVRVLPRPDLEEFESANARAH